LKIAWDEWGVAGRDIVLWAKKIKRNHPSLHGAIIRPAFG